MEEPIINQPGVSEEELRRLEEAQKVFIRQGNPYPERFIVPSRVVTGADIRKRYGLEVFLMGLSTIGAAYLSAVRVGLMAEISQLNLEDAFLQSETQATNLISAKPTFWASLVAVEGFLIAIGIRSGRNKTEVTFNYWSVGIAFAVSILAGFLSTLTIIDAPQLQTAISWIFAAVSAVSASLIAYFGSENIGFIMQQIDNLQAEYDEDTRQRQELEDQKFEQRVALWQDNFQRVYPRIAKQLWGLDRRRRVRYEDEQPREQKAREETEGPQRNLRQDLKDWLVSCNIKPSMVGQVQDESGVPITPSYIADQLGLTAKSQRDAIRKYNSQFREEEKAGKWLW